MKNILSETSCGLQQTLYDNCLIHTYRGQIDRYLVHNVNFWPVEFDMDM